MGFLNFFTRFLALTSFLAPRVSGYDVRDLHTLNLQIEKSTGDMLSFDLALNEDNQFSATIQNLDAGLTNITLNGYDVSGTRMYNGDWEGQVRQDGKPTQVELFMTDLKPDIDVTTLSNIAPFFLSIEMEPSNIAKNETVVIKTRAKDLDDDVDALKYTFRPLSPLFGEVRECRNGSEYCSMQYHSDMLDTNGVKEFEMDVSDGTANDTVKGGFNIRAYGGVNLVINFNNRPGVSSISTDNSFLYDEEGHDRLSVNVTLFDDNFVFWTWTVEGIDPACDADGLSGDTWGQYALERDVSIQFRPARFVESECKLRLLLRDQDDAALTYELEIPFYVGNKLYNTAPFISMGYSTASSAVPGTMITYVIYARDRGDGELRATWDVTGAGTIQAISSTNSTSRSTPTGFSEYTFVMKLNATGESGNVRCSVEDVFQLKTQLDFTVGQYTRLYGAPSPSPPLSPSLPTTPTPPSMSTTTTTTTTTTSSSSSHNNIAACASSLGFIDTRDTLREMMMNYDGCADVPPGYYAEGCHLFQTGVNVGDPCHSMARSSSSCTLKGCDGQNPPQCDQAELTAQGPRVTTRAWSKGSFDACASACSATMNSYWHGIYIKQCETGCVMQACDSAASRRLVSALSPRAAKTTRRRLEATGGGPIVNPYVFGLSMSIEDRTLSIRSNPVPSTRADDNAPSSKTADASDTATSSSTSSHLPLSLGIGGGCVALVVGTVLFKRSQAPPVAAGAREVDLA